MKYLITGGTGLIGKGLIAELVQQRADITVLTRNIRSAKTSLGSELKFIDKLSSDDIENSDVVINLAGEAIADKRWSKSQKNKICQSRWQITQKLAELINQVDNPPSLFISGSAIGMYGRQGNEPIDESFKNFHHEFTHEVCSTWEALAISAASNKTRVAILRTGVVLAKNKGALAKMLPPFKMGVGGQISDGEQFMSWIHYEDIIGAIIHILQNKELEGSINLTSPLAISNTEFSQVLASQLKRPCFFTTPAWLLKTVFGEMADILLFGQNVYPTKLVNSGYSFKFTRIKAAISDLIS